MHSLYYKSRIFSLFSKDLICERPNEPISYNIGFYAPEIEVLPTMHDSHFLPLDKIILSRNMFVPQTLMSSIIPLNRAIKKVPNV